VTIPLDLVYTGPIAPIASPSPESWLVKGVGSGPVNYFPLAVESYSRREATRADLVSAHLRNAGGCGARARPAHVRTGNRDSGERAVQLHTVPRPWLHLASGGRRALQAWPLLAHVPGPAHKTAGRTRRCTALSRHVRVPPVLCY
jgi:hypothetical protein